MASKSIRALTAFARELNLVVGEHVALYVSPYVYRCIRVVGEDSNLFELYKWNNDPDVRHIIAMNYYDQSLYWLVFRQSRSLEFVALVATNIESLCRKYFDPP